MTALSIPFFALRPQRDGLRQKQFSPARPRSGGHGMVTSDIGHGAAPDCVFKRLPAIGDTPSVLKQRW